MKLHLNSVDLTEEEYKAFRIRLIVKGLSIKDLVTKLVKDYIKEEDK